MGYCIEQRGGRFKICKENQDLAFDAILKSTADLISKKHTPPWVRVHYVMASRSIHEALEEWRWNTVIDEDRNIVYLRFTGQKSGSDLHMFKAIAEFVEPGSYIEMAGEDGAIWRWFFNGVTCVIQEGRVSFEEV